MTCEIDQWWASLDSVRYPWFEYSFDFHRATPTCRRFTDADSSPYSHSLTHSYQPNHAYNSTRHFTVTNTWQGVTVWSLTVKTAWYQWWLAGLEAKILSSACPRTVYFGLVVKMNVIMELVIIVSLQWLYAKVIYLLALCYWYKLVQVHVHDSI